MQNTLFKILCLIFALQGLLASAASGHNLRMLNVQNQADVLVICTGSQTKWISASTYFESGKIVEIDKPSDAEQDAMQLGCFNHFAFDHKPVSPLADFHSLLTPFVYTSIAFPRLAYGQSNPFYIHAPSRAPPFAFPFV